MGFFDDLKERLGFGEEDYYDDYYEDEEYDEEIRRSPRDRRSYSEDEYDEYESDIPPVEHDYEGEPQGILGNTSRPNVDSVSVYTRSGHPVDTTPNRTDSAAPAPYERNTTVTGDASWTDSRLDYTPAASANYGPSSSAAATSNLRPLPENMGRVSAATPRSSSTNLPPYVLRPTAYDDCQTVMRRVRTNQPVVLAFSTTDLDTAKRILDFSFGFACGINGRVEEIGERTFCVLPEGAELSQSDFDRLVREGVLAGEAE